MSQRDTTTLWAAPDGAPRAEPRCPASCRYRPLAEVICEQQVSVLRDVSGTMMGFCFPDALDGIEMVGAHLHCLTDDRTRGGHVLSYTLLDAIARLDGATRLHVELPGTVRVPRHGSTLDQTVLQRLESDR